ncbi:hypothetical protein K432DRAFT_304763 [Lepidopterella palustris CBS 459.81]|uniref:Uncharacterized protein n=1 Tax=Lepidopterella palustris CBS 459.81 TaxID=1314670 RepID=A0A8E2E4E9_9PEZI|nr:hypothetical protein K432DRAFT_304763 [Lepidopterella palustris CBS 459.81]
MLPSSRLYERLGAMPSNPEDPESVAELVVVAFGAFERYYVCWRNQAGEYKQDSYGLPARLHEWLYPVNGQGRHFPTLQVVLGRGDEFFASDKDGKLENVDIDLREKIPRVDSPVEKTERSALRRSRTLSFVRPTSDPVSKPFSPIIESPNRSSASTVVRQPRERPRSIAFTSALFSQFLEREKPRKACICTQQSQPSSRSGYVDASVQTDQEPVPIHQSSIAIESDISTVASHSSRTSISEISTPLTTVSAAPNPVVMGRMLDYFNAPKYQLGDALRSTYHHVPVYPDFELCHTWMSVLDRRRTV